MSEAWECAWQAVVVQPLEVVEATGPSEAEKGVVGTKWLKPETGMRVRLTDKVYLTQCIYYLV